jgi:hypothetical protein
LAGSAKVSDARFRRLSIDRFWRKAVISLLHKKARRWPYQRVPFHMAEGGKIIARSAWKEFAELRQSNLCCCHVVTLSPIGRCQRVRAALSFAQQLQHEIVGREGDSLIGRFVVHTLGFETAARPRWREPAQQAEQN